MDNNIPTNPAPSKPGLAKVALRTVVTVIELVVVLAFFAAYLLWGAPGLQKLIVQADHQPATSLSMEEAEQLTAKLEKETNTLQVKFEKLTPNTPYAIINTTQNEYRLFSKRKEVRRGFCSTGSYTKLYTEKKTWVFKTPKGVRRVISKITNPVWIKPDWAFVEEGIPIPPAGHPSRYESGTLGDYALALGDGYLIHGTLYQRFLGQSVTHGCVRMGDEDLEAVYKTLQNGSKVYIY